MSNTTVQKTNDSAFSADVLEAKGPVLVDFWADWCGPCHALAPVLDELAADYAGRVEIQKLNVDENPEATAKYGIRSLPTLMLFQDGEPLKAFTGVQPKMKLASILDQVAN